MLWAMWRGEGHALLALDNDHATAVCGKEAEQFIDFTPQDTEEGVVVEARPFGPDTCRVCHQTVKGWQHNPSLTPEGLFDQVKTPEERRVMGAEARRKAIEGKSEPEGAQVPPRTRARQEDTSRVAGDDLEFPDEPGAGAVSMAGALVVTPTRKRRPAASVVAVDEDIDT